MRSFP